MLARDGLGWPSLSVESRFIESRASSNRRAPDSGRPDPSPGEIPVNAVPIAAQPNPSTAVAAFLKRKPRLLIAAEWVEASTGAMLDVIDPATGKTISSIADASKADVDRAVAAARAAFEQGPWPD